MNLVSKNKKKNNFSNKFGIKKQLNGFKYCFNGIINSLKNEQSMIIHFFTAIVVIIVGLAVKLSKIEWFIVIILISIVIAFELVNTAIENICDMVMPDIHPLAKIAKDSAAGAVLIVSIAAAIIGIIIFGPKLF